MYIIFGREDTNLNWSDQSEEHMFIVESVMWQITKLINNKEQKSFQYEKVWSWEKQTSGVTKWAEES